MTDHLNNGQVIKVIKQQYKTEHHGIFIILFYCITMLFVYDDYFIFFMQTSWRHTDHIGFVLLIIAFSFLVLVLLLFAEKT